MNDDTKNTLTITELFSEHLLHDFANSISGLIFGFEELKASDQNNTQKEVISLLEEIFNDLINKHRIMRQAYAYSESNLSFEKTKLNIESHLLKKKFRLSGTLIIFSLRKMI
ncbi:hypothetical protein [Wolbachia endosymbiont of Pentidionis agamae]|uniref:hypothetical protein n=1 Tax=Wolbachia endosymbiont of Pentidionis agamae TaxID=3110435 RepID=UPI002FD69080